MTRDIAIGNPGIARMTYAMSKSGAKLQKMQTSIATGRDQFASPIDRLVGGGLENQARQFAAVADNFGYVRSLTGKAGGSVNIMLNCIQACYAEVSKAQSGAVLTNPTTIDSINKSIDVAKQQIRGQLGTNFDGQPMWGGQSLSMQIGTGLNDTTPVKLTHLGRQLFTSSVAISLNKAIMGIPAADLADTTGYYVADAPGEAARKMDNANNVNLIWAVYSGTRKNAETGGTGTTAGITAEKFADLIVALPAEDKAKLNLFAPHCRTALTTANAGVTFTNATAAQLVAIFGVAANVMNTLPTNADAGLSARGKEIEAILNNELSTLAPSVQGSLSGSIPLAQDKLDATSDVLLREQKNLSDVDDKVDRSFDLLVEGKISAQTAADELLATDENEMVNQLDQERMQQRRHQLMVALESSESQRAIEHMQRILQQ